MLSHFREDFAEVKYDSIRVLLELTNPVLK